MGVIDVGTEGNCIDITSAEMMFNGDTLSAAVSTLEWTCKTEEEVIHYQGLQDAQERTAGQRTYEASLTWGTRQYVLFCEKMGGWDAVKNMEFTLVVNASPRNDPKLYSFTFRKFRLKDDSMNLDKSASMNKISASFLSYDQKAVTRNG